MRWLRASALFFLCILPWVGVIYGVSWILRAHFPVDGHATIDIPINGRSPWFEAFLPGQRATSPGEQSGGWIGQRITDEPVYARLRLPGAYEAADVELEIRPNEQPLLELGIERGQEPAVSYEMRPIWSQQLTASGFVTTSVEGVSWWVDSALGDRAARSSDEGRAAWHASGTIAVASADVGPVQPTRVEASLRGQHDWWFVPVDGKLAFSAVLQDMNRSRATASATWRLMRDQELLWSDAVNFGGQEDTKPSELVERTWQFTDLRPGVYRLSLLADDSIFVRSWTIGARHWVVGPRVYFADEVGYATTTRGQQVWTNSTHIEVKTLHKEGLQTISLGSATTTLLATHTAYSLSRALDERRGPSPLVMPKGNVWIVGNAYVSWSKEALFYPTVQRLTDQTHLRDEGIQAVASVYQAPEPLEDGWYRVRVRFALDPRLDRAKLVLAAPGIARRGAAVDVRRIRATYTRPPRNQAWWEVVRQELVRAWRRW